MGGNNSKGVQDTSPKKKFEDTLAKINVMLESTPNGPALKSLVNVFYNKSKIHSDYLEVLEKKPELNMTEGIETRSRWEELKELYEKVKQAEVRYSGSQENQKAFADFRGYMLRPMRDDLQAKSLRIVSRAPPPPTPVYIDPLQARLDRLKRAGRRKTRSKKSRTRKYKHRN